MARSAPASFALLVLASATLFDCGEVPPRSRWLVLGGRFPCPNLDRARDIAELDWKRSFGLDAAAEAELEVAIDGAVELRALSARIDADLGAACGRIANDLGFFVAFGPADSACGVALQRMGDMKAKLGPDARLTLEVQPPECALRDGALAECVASCHAASADCEATCGVKILRELHCTAARVSFEVHDAADGVAADKLQATLEKNLPRVVTVALGTRERALAAAAPLEGLYGRAKRVVEASPGNAVSDGLLARCVAGTFDDALTAAKGMTNGLNFAARMQASAASMAAEKSGG